MPRIRPPPGLVLFLLAPAVGELLSGSSPPAEYFTPFGFTIMTTLYGGGAVLCRGLKVRWRKGMGSLLLLGAAHGVLEKGAHGRQLLQPRMARPRRPRRLRPLARRQLGLGR